MLIMVIEHFKDGNAEPQQDRMLPEDVTYRESWIEWAGLRCFQLMEAPNVESLIPWVNRWNNLVEFRIVPVLTSSDFWSAKSGVELN